jgi:hypothetical protein
MNLRMIVMHMIITHMTVMLANILCLHALHGEDLMCVLSMSRQLYKNNTNRHQQYGVLTDSLN